MADVSNIEKLRLDLERQVEKLRTSLRHWQLWEAEYEGFKEEVETLADEATVEDVVECGIEFGGEIIDEAEVKDLVQYSGRRRRSKKEVLAAVAARAATGHQNAASVQKQLDKVESKLEELESVAMQDDKDNQDPVMEITEVLDDNDNIIESKVVNANQETDWLDKKLREAGAESILSEDHNNVNEDNIGSQDKIANDREAASIFKETIIEPPGPGSIIPANTITRQLLELDSNDQIIGKRTLQVPISADQTLKHQKDAMRTAADEIGPIVATMDILDDDDSDFTDELADLNEDYDDEEHWDDELDENEFGANAISDEFTPEYLAEMKALMDKYQPMMTNIGPDQDAGFPRANPINKLPTPMPSERTSTSAVAPRVAPAQPLKKTSSAKKGVRFADDLDMAPEQSKLSALANVIETKADPPKVEDAATISVDVIERRPMSTAQAPQVPGAKGKKMSRFKAAQMGLS